MACVGLSSKISLLPQSKLRSLSAIRPMIHAEALMTSMAEIVARVESACQSPIAPATKTMALTGKAKRERNSAVRVELRSFMAFSVIRDEILARARHRRPTATLRGTHQGRGP